MTYRIFPVALVVALLGASAAEGANRYVCAAGANCDSGSTHGAGTSYATITLALAAAGSGDTIYIRAGETFEEAIVLPDKGELASPITLRSDAPDSSFPAAGHRLVPTVREDGVTLIGGRPLSGNTDPDDLPSIVSTGSGLPTIRTETGAATQDYVLRFLRFPGTPGGFNEMIRLGHADGQEWSSLMAQDITIDRCLFEAIGWVGQKIGVGINGKNLRIENSYFANIVGLGQDALCASGANGLGPIYFNNNFCEAGIGFITGGDNPRAYTTVTTDTGSTATVLVYDPATFRSGHSEALHSLGTSMTDLIGAHIAIQVNAATSFSRRWGYVTAVNATSNTITIDTDLDTVGNQGIDIAPAAGMEIKWGAIYDGIEFKRNHMYNPLRWKTGILDTPLNVTVEAQTSAGSLATGSYFYVITAMNVDGYNGNNVFSGRSVEVECELDATGQCVLDWDAVTGASHYRVNGRSSGSSSMYFLVAAPTTTYTDTGTAGTAGARVSASFWQLKNHYEVKQGNNVVVSENIFENKWWTSSFGGTFSGTPIWLKSNNGGGSAVASFNQSKNVLVEWNYMFNVGGCIHMTSQEEGATGIERRPDHLEDVTIKNNLCVARSDHAATNQPMWGIGYQGPKNTVFENNTMYHPRCCAISLQNTTTPWAGTISIDNNIMWHNTYGAVSGEASFGLPALEAHFGPVSTNYLNNVVTAGTYAQPATTLRPSVADLQAAFVEFGGTDILDWALKAGHAYRTAGTGGGIVGADIETLASKLSGVLEGTPSGDPSWATPSGALPQATSGTSYSTQVVAVGGTAPIAYSKTSGTLPTGTTLNTSTGVISGTVTGGAATYNFTITATDAGATAISRAFSIEVNAATVTVEILTTTLPSMNTGQSYSQTLNATGPAGARAWTHVGQLPIGVALDPSTGVISGSTTQSGSFVFTVTLVIGSGSDDQVLTLVVNEDTGPQEPPDPGEKNRHKRWQGSDLRSFATEAAPTVEDDEVQPKDIWVDSEGRLCIITATAPDVTYDCYTKSPTIIPFNASATEVPIVDSPVGGREFGSSTTGTDPSARPSVDLRYASEFRFVTYISNASAVSGNTIRPEYSDDDGETWVELSATADSASLSVEGDEVRLDSGWLTLADGAKIEDCWLRLYQMSGDGTDDIGVKYTYIEVR